MSHTYLVIFEIVDDDRPLSALRAEASAALDAMAARDGARLTATRDPKWTFTGNRLVCEFPAEPAGDPAPAGQVAERAKRDLEVLRLHGLGWSLRQIGRALHMSHTTVAGIIARDRKPG